MINTDTTVNWHGSKIHEFSWENILQIVGPCLPGPLGKLALWGTVDKTENIYNNGHRLSIPTGYKSHYDILYTDQMAIISPPVKSLDWSQKIDRL